MSAGTTLRPVSARDRTTTLVLVAAAIVAWFVVALIFTTVSPERDAMAQLLGALALGAAVALTLWPLLWSAGPSSPGAIVTSGRRSALAGLLVTILVVLRAIDVVTVPVLIFRVVGAVLVEIAFSLRR